MDINIDKQDQSVPPNRGADSYPAIAGQLESFSFGPDVEPVYYRREGELMVRRPLDQMVH